MANVNPTINQQVQVLRDKIATAEKALADKIGALKTDKEALTALESLGLHAVPATPAQS